MDTKNNTKKGKKILWLFLFLIALIVIVAVSVVINLKINGTFLSRETQNVINKYKETIIESVPLPSMMETNQLSEDINEEKLQILELQKTIKELQSKIKTNDSVDYSQNIKFIVNSSLLSNKLQNGEPFAKELDELIKVLPKPLFENKLNKVRSYSEFGIKTKDELIKDYQTVYQKTYSAYLQSDNSTFSKIKAYFMFLVFIKKTNTNLLQDDTSVVNKLANVETYLIRNDFQKAYSEFIKIPIEPSTVTKKWLEDMQKRIEANQLIKEINIELNNYLKLGSK